ncbi:MAG TPA: PQQ-binding-like beta-propeller repeat protein [Fimbriimonadaceae bacterium]|nr:PQQ-binding-like beta-propeller repeat protein [Fimbriimonadaceae bacterium]
MRWLVGSLLLTAVVSGLVGCGGDSSRRPIFGGPPPGATLAGWPKFMGTPANTGRVDVANAGGQVRWKFRVNGLAGPAAISPDGTVYFGIQEIGSGLYAVDLASGAVKWSKPQFANFVGAPAIGSSGLLYVYLNNGLYAFNAQNGNQVWAQAAIGSNTDGPAVGPDGTVYIGTAEPSIVAFDGRTGATLWDCSTGSSGSVVSCPALDGSGNVYAVQSDGSIVAVKAGRLLWKVQTNFVGHRTSITVGPNGLLYVIAGLNEFQALRADTGAQVWSVPANSNNRGQVIGPDGTVYTSSLNPNALIAYNPANGQVLRSKPVLGNVGLHAMTNSTLYVEANGGVTAYDAATFAAKWTIGTQGFIGGAVALAGDGTVVFPASDFYVYAVR